MKKKLVLKIRNSTFLLKVYSNRIETCNHIKDAMDISELDKNVLNNILKHLTDNGYKEVKVMEVGK